MEIRIIIFFIGIALSLFLLGKHYFEAKEAGPFTAGFILVILAILIMTTGINYKTGEECSNYNTTNGYCEKTDFVYSEVGTLERVASSAVFLISGLILFFTGYSDRNKRIEASL